jgi:peptidoglycan/LPS O-acetylase OafA/YrhL
VKTLLVVISSLTLVATGFLSLSLLILHPPRANYQEWFPMAALFLTQGGLTLFAVSRGESARWIRGLLVAGGIAILCVGGLWAYATASAPHFEGYALILGSALAIQGALTATVFWPVQRTL